MSTSASSRSSLTRGQAIGLVSAALLATTAISIRYLTQTYHTPALVLAFWRDGFVALTLLPVLGALKPCLLQIKRRHLIDLIAYGFILAIFNAGWTPAVALNGAALATVLVCGSAGTTALLGWWFLKERVDWVKLLAAAFSLEVVCGLQTRSIHPPGAPTRWVS